jgi:hypothetical protein
MIFVVALIAALFVVAIVNAIASVGDHRRKR